MSSNYLKIQKVIDEVSKVVVGQDYMIKRLLMGLFTQGHILLEGGTRVSKDPHGKHPIQCSKTEFQKDSVHT